MLHLSFVPPNKVLEYYLLIKDKINEELIEDTENVISEEVKRRKKNFKQAVNEFIFYFEKSGWGLLMNQG